MNMNIPVDKNKITTTIKEKDSIPKNTELATRSPDTKDDCYTKKEYVIFKNQFQSMKRNNIVILKESKENKRLLDLKYDDLNNQINMIQTSVIFFSTISGFLQATKEYFNTDNSIVTVSSISISTYISLILSVSKYLKFDEQKERIHNLREKYANLHNKIEFRMDVLGPWTWKELWEHQDPTAKLQQWNLIVEEMDTEYAELIEVKQALCTEYEIIMDSKSRNKYYIKNRELNYSNRVKINAWDKKEAQLEKDIEAQRIKLPHVKTHAVSLPNEDLDNWDDDFL
tara:strand:+ start:1476 stop:2327 length:852 start_codon:yes stop_codon:yes gene_type:complete